MKSTTIFGKGLGFGMKAALAVLALAAAAPGTAEAQYYTPGGGYYREAPPPGYYRPRPREYQPYYGDGYAVQPRYRAYGSICVTSRGNCSIGRPVPLPAGCVCNIPGFGKKRGSVQ